MFTPGTPGTGQGRSLRLALVLTSLFVLLALVAFASRSGLGQSSRAQPTPGYISWAVSIFFVLWVVTIPFAIYAYVMQTRERLEQQRARRSFQSRVLRGLVVVGIVLVIFGAREILRRHDALLRINAFWLHPGHGRGADATANRPYHPTFQWPVLWVTIVLGVAALCWWWWDRRNRPPLVNALGDPTVEDDMIATIGDAIDDLEAEPDARRAVIAAYARMEDVFARHGMRRIPSETPVEYLRRLLLGLTSRADAVTRLTGLFERAKFSRHEIDGAMKQDAIDALRIIRDDLQPA